MVILINSALFLGVLSVSFEICTGNISQRKVAFNQVCHHLFVFCFRPATGAGQQNVQMPNEYRRDDQQPEPVQRWRGSGSPPQSPTGLPPRHQHLRYLHCNGRSKHIAQSHRRYGIKSRHTTILVLYNVNYFPVAFMDTRAECVKKRRRNKIGIYEFSSEASKTRLTPIIQNK